MPACRDDKTPWTLILLTLFKLLFSAPQDALGSFNDMVMVTELVRQSNRLRFA